MSNHPADSDAAGYERPRYEGTGSGLHAQRQCASEIKASWQLGVAADARAVLDEQGDHPWHKSVALDLAYEEYCLRTEAGEQIDLDAFCGRFSSLERSLRRLIDVHQFVVSNLEPIQWPAAGDEFLGLRLIEKLGEGAFARVFLASEAALGNRLVVVKIAQYGTREAETLGRMDHPHIVPIHSIRQDAATGLTAICMPFLSRATLFDIIEEISSNGTRSAHPGLIDEMIADLNRDAPDSTSLHKGGPGSYIDQVASLGAELADALASAHARGILHLDVKPSNILLAPGRHSMLLDFNLAHEEQAASTGTGFGGTLPYMAPEQLQGLAGQEGNASAPDARADIFSLGTTLYEALAGSIPFGPFLPGPREQILAQLLKRQQRGPRPLRELNPRVDRALAATIESCLAFDRKDRPQSASELSAKLRKHFALNSRARRWVWSHRWAVSAAILLCSVSGAAATRVALSQAPYPIRQYQQGLAELQADNCQAAIRCFDNALKEDPGYLPAVFTRGQARQRLGKFQAALEDHGVVLAQGPHAAAFAAAGYCFSGLQQHKPARMYNLKAVELNFATAEVFNNLGYSCLKLGELDEAQTYLDRAIGLDPGLQFAFYNRALLDRLRAVQNVRYIPTAGLQDIRRAMKLGPLTPELCRDAAGLACLVARNDPRALEEGLGLLSLAIEQGLDPRQLDDYMFEPLKANPKFAALRAHPVPVVARVPTRRILDPLPANRVVLTVDLGNLNASTH